MALEHCYHKVCLLFLIKKLGTGYGWVMILLIKISDVIGVVFIQSPSGLCFIAFQLLDV